MADEDHITVREFDGFKEAVVSAISESSSGVHKRLDGIDRRFDTAQRTTNELLRVSGVHATKLDEHERRLNHGQGRKAETKPDDDSKPVTRREINVAVGVGILCVGGIVWLFMTFGPFIQKGAP